jgi:hypothetical protein
MVRPRIPRAVGGNCHHEAGCPAARLQVGAFRRLVEKSSKLSECSPECSYSVGLFGVRDPLAKLTGPDRRKGRRIVHRAEMGSGSNFPERSATNGLGNGVDGRQILQDLYIQPEFVREEDLPTLG